MVHWILLWDAGPTSSTAKVLERWVLVLLMVVEVLSQTRREQVLDGVTRVWAEVSGSSHTGLVPDFMAYPSSTFVGMEWIEEVVVVAGRTHLSDDKDAVEDVGSKLGGSKRWGRGG